MKPGTLIILSGLPGSGKSTLGKHLTARLGATYLRIDTIKQGLRDLCGLSQVRGEGYALAYRIAQENLAAGMCVIADSVNPWALTRKEWNNVAEEIGAPFLNVEVVCSDRAEHRRRVESREPFVPGLKPPTWEEVTNRDYHPWQTARLVLDTSEKSVDQCVGDVVAALGST